MVSSIKEKRPTPPARYSTKLQKEVFVPEVIRFMALIDQVTTEIKAAMKAQRILGLETLRSMKKALLEKEITVRPAGRTELTEAEEVEALAQQAKQRRDAVEQYQQAGRPDLAAKEAQELDIIEAYLPKQLSDTEVAAVIEQIVHQVGATSAKDMGKVMGPVMKQLKGRADGQKVQALVKARLES